MIYDCFIFNDELDLLEIRLRELSEVVDQFVLVEGDRTLSGKPKRLYFADQRSRFRRFSNQLVHLPITGDAWPPGHDAWTREWHQRNHIQRALDHCKPDDLIIISDADEIASSHAVRLAATSTTYCKFDQLNHYYYLNVRSNIPWAGTVALRYEQLLRIGSATGARQLPPNQDVLLAAGGWHFSYLGGPERIRTKIESFAHTELDQDAIKDLYRIKDRIDTLKDLFDRVDHQYRVVVLDESYPRYLLENRDKFRSLIYTADSRP